MSRIQRLTALLILFAISASLPAQFLGGGGEKLPKIRSPRGIANAPLIAVFSAGRPWQGEDMANAFVTAGFRVLPLTSVYLDGHGGATIKPHITDKVEPRAFDGITPVLRDSGGYDAIFFHMIPTDEMAKIFTPEKISQLRRYVHNGGHILFDYNVPAALQELLPVSLGAFQTVADDSHLQAELPSDQAFSVIPAGAVPVWRKYRQATPIQGARVLSTIRTAQGTALSAMLATRVIGRGSVTFLNAECINPHQMHDFANWAYARVFIITAIKNAIGQRASMVDASRNITPLEPYPERTSITEPLTIALQQPVFTLDRCRAAGGIEKFTGSQESRYCLLSFPNGMTVTVQRSGVIAVSWEGEEFIRQSSIPDLRASKQQQVFDSDTAEAVDIKENITSHKLSWELQEVQLRDGEAVLRLTAGESVMEWILTAGTLNLDGRIFQGIGERVNILSCPLLISSIGFLSQLTLPDALTAPRNSCYMPPRGFTEFDMSGAVKSDTTSWSPYGSGQPFAQLNCRNAVYLSFADSVEPTSFRFFRDKGQKSISAFHSTAVGRSRAPFSTKTTWHWLSKGPAGPHHDEFLSAYQFLRQRYRRECHLKEFPPYPNAGYGYQLTKKEIKEVIRQAARIGYRYAARPNPESPIDKIADPANCEIYSFTKECGMGCWTWSAGGYVQGNGGWIINAHPEWFIRDERNRLHQYFGKYPVIDLSTPEFYDWYTGVFKRAFAAGLSWVYRDMDGAASGGINYAKDHSPSALYSLIKYYRFFHENNVRVAVEGMNALVLDEYWYRPALYTSFRGKEYSLVGQVPSDSLRGGVTLDPFRTGMYCCFPRFEIQDAIFGIEKIPGELERIRRTFSFVPKFNDALDLCGMPYIRETPFGTTWIGDKGAALFFWNPVKELTLKLPAGWHIRGHHGQLLKDIPGDTILLVDRD